MTALYAVIGRPIAHSRSPDIHRAFARACGQDIAYERIEGAEGGFARAVDAFRARGGLGLNITTPFKLDASAYAARLSEDARLAGAVNCLCFRDGLATGHNFDGVGVLRDIEHNLGMPLAGRRVLLLGAGGAARGALRPLLGAGPAELVVANRTPATAAALVAAVARPGTVLRATGLGAIEGGFDLVLNATSTGLSGAALPVPAAAFAPGCLAYDMTYGRGLTPFLLLARESGAGRVANGVGMLVEQAAEAFALWRGVRPGTAAVIREMTVPLG